VQHSATQCNTLQHSATHATHENASPARIPFQIYFSVLQCVVASVAVRVFYVTVSCCRVLQSFIVCCSVLQCATHKIRITCLHPKRRQHYPPPPHHATRCKTLQDTAAHCSTLQHTETTCCNTLQSHPPLVRHFTHIQNSRHTLTNTSCHTCTTCITRPLQHTATHCTTLHHTAPHCTTLQHTTTHCNTLQQNCNTLQHTITCSHPQQPQPHPPPAQT